MNQLKCKIFPTCMFYAFRSFFRHQMYPVPEAITKNKTNLALSVEVQWYKLQCDCTSKIVLVMMIVHD